MNPQVLATCQPVCPLPVWHVIYPTALPALFQTADPCVSFGLTINNPYHPNGLAGAYVVIVAVPTLKLWIFSVLQDVLLALEVRVVITDEGSTLHADGVDPVHEATVLEVVTFTAYLQLKPGETFPLVEYDLTSHTKKDVRTKLSDISILHCTIFLITNILLDFSSSLDRKSVV